MPLTSDDIMLDLFTVTVPSGLNVPVFSGAEGLPLPPNSGTVVPLPVIGLPLVLPPVHTAVSSVCDVCLCSTTEGFLDLRGDNFVVRTF